MAHDIDAIIDRYVAQWNEPDAVRRRAAIAAIWTEDAAHTTRSVEARGHAELETRVASAYETWVKEKGYRFRRAAGADSHRDAIKMRWEMVDGDSVLAVGCDFLLLASDGRIRRDAQFIEAQDATI